MCNNVAMIEVTAKLVHGSVYLAGEALECKITFRNPGGTSDDTETCAWASAQIHCQCSVADGKVAFPFEEAKTPEAKATQTTGVKSLTTGIFKKITLETVDTSFIASRGERGHVVLTTKPKILFCDLKLAPGQSCSFVYQESIPHDAPPSYRGHAVKYTYKLTIGTQRVGSPIKLLRVPIRILVLYGLVEARWSSDTEDVSPSNPFLDTQQKETPLDTALQLLQRVTARRSPSFYNITNNHGKVVRFGLFKLSYKQGEDIVGTFDFTQSTVPCVQFLVTLQSEETISETCKKRSHQHSHVVSYNKYHETCLHMRHTRMVLPIPLSVTPSFQTEIVSLHWKLHFEFVTTTSDSCAGFTETPTSSEPVTWHAPSQLDIETMVWDLPIRIFPTSPVLVTQGMHLENQHTGVF